MGCNSTKEVEHNAQSLSKLVYCLKVGHFASVCHSCQQQKKPPAARAIGTNEGTDQEHTESSPKLSTISIQQVATVEPTPMVMVHMSTYSTTDPVMLKYYQIQGQIYQLRASLFYHNSINTGTTSYHQSSHHVQLMGKRYMLLEKCVYIFSWAVVKMKRTYTSSHTWVEP